jgi:hypothetical protein
MKEENQIIIISGFLGFTIGAFFVMMISTDTQVNCYNIIEDIEMEVCEECWHEVFEMGEKYEEVQYYVNGE